MKLKELSPKVLKSEPDNVQVGVFSGDGFVTREGYLDNIV